jgi:protocatechuate 3,4-dioxygenase beta subunit
MSDPHDDTGLQLHLKQIGARPARRELLLWLGAAALLPSTGCSGDKGGERGGDSDGAGDSVVDTGAEACEALPQETPGPYPGDGSNGENALALDDIVRGDMRTSIGDRSGTAQGTPLIVRLRVVDVASGCAPLVGYAVYLWHATKDGLYSMYTDPDQNYLRGVQVSDSDGWVTFTTIFPGCYDGRWPHMHFEIFRSLDDITSASNAVSTSQLALPREACEEVYAGSGYEISADNLTRVSLATDGVFRDGATSQVATVTGAASGGMEATLVLGVG